LLRSTRIMHEAEAHGGPTTSTNDGSRCQISPDLSQETQCGKAGVQDGPLATSRVYVAMRLRYQGYTWSAHALRQHQLAIALQKVLRLSLSPAWKPGARRAGNVT
jgi:hypothetical protein